MPQEQQLCERGHPAREAKPLPGYHGGIITVCRGIVRVRVKTGGGGRWDEHMGYGYGIWDMGYEMGYR